mmetsp:Transcript_114307/g.355946  ORF Transcript_114307/g.355946 Transcript_114307/m.355946 type:complete len:465 (-) Transcript_114307:8-1402(-)
MEERRLGACLLFVLCATCGDAVRLHARRDRATPVVVGTTMLDDREMAGELPIFVDAFPNAGGTELDIILNLSPLIPFDALRFVNQAWKKWTHTTWQCKWATPDTIPTSEGHVGTLGKSPAAINFAATRAYFAVTSAYVKHSTFGEAARNLTELDMMGRRKQHTFHGLHHALVLGCPMPGANSWGLDKDWYLTLSASGEGVLYERSDIPVPRSSFVKPGTGIALCTMLVRETEQTPSRLRQWVRFHLAEGIDQILLYVEEADPTWANEAIADLPDAAKVTVVPFFFGNISNKRAFYMQGGMENHCLFQAQSRAEWLAHADIDEYFDTRSEGGLGIRKYLDRVPSGIGAVQVRSQYWNDEAEKDSHDLPYPCSMTCKQPGYLNFPDRSKWVARPLEVRVDDVHRVAMIGSAERYVASPTTELRLNHYRDCELGISLNKTQHKRCRQRGRCRTDLSFRDKCTSTLGG